MCHRSYLVADGVDVGVGVDGKREAAGPLFHYEIGNPAATNLSGNRATKGNLRVYAGRVSSVGLFRPCHNPLSLSFELAIQSSGAPTTSKGSGCPGESVQAIADREDRLRTTPIWHEQEADKLHSEARTRYVTLAIWVACKKSWS